MKTTKSNFAARHRSAFFCLLIAAGVVLLIYSVFEPRWETNDDIAMSMVAHGYGIAAHASPNLIFSNAVWGEIIQFIPEVNGLTGYSIATLIVLLASAYAILFFLQSLGAGIFVCTAAIALIIFRAAVFPQFTINSGLLTCASVLALLDYNKSHKKTSLALSCALGYFGYLIRAEEFLLVLAISIPILPWHFLRRNRQFIAAALILATLIAGSAFFDRQSYKSKEWDYFKELNLARAPFTDFGAGERAKQHSNILSAHGYTQNDIELITAFFFSDKSIANPAKLFPILKELGPFSSSVSALQLGWDSIKSLKSANTLPLLLAALILSIARPSMRIFLCWALFTLAVFLTGVLGRGGVSRVYIPPLALLFSLSVVNLYSTTAKPHLFSKKIGRKFINIACGGAIISCVLFTWLAVMPLAADAKADIEKARIGAASMPREMVVAWGAGLPIESIYPVFANDLNLRKLRILPLGVFTDAPFSVAYAEEKIGRGFVERIRSQQGILMVAAPGNIDRLSIWCKERYHGSFNSEVAYSAPMVHIVRIWCQG